VPTNYQLLKELIAIDSPSGFTHKACEYIFNTLTAFGLQPTYTRKGAVKCNLGEHPRLSIAAHVDTLGAVVAAVRADGTLRISTVGGLSLTGFEGAYCRIYTRKGEKFYTGTLLLDNPATHNNRNTETATRSLDNLHIRLDELVQNTSDIQELGIAVGDFICFEPHYEETSAGFIKSRFMDNKAGCLVLLEIAKYVAETGTNYPVELFFSNYEEVGHGGAGGYAATMEELLVVDMGVVGNERTGKETHCSICAKDSASPYDYEMRTRLTNLAEAKNIPFAVDIYPYYGSDGSAAWRAGVDAKVALIGMGVSASHGVERTHKNGIQATIDLCLAYMEDFKHNNKA
jgi:putative aminopeptidase FrvX